MKTPPHFPHPTSFRHERGVKRAMKDFPNGTGYGTIMILLEILASQPDMRYPIEDIDILSDEIGISIPIIRTIIEKYGIFSITTEEDSKSFFSAKMDAWLEPYFRKIEENRIKGIKSGLVRKAKIKKEIENLNLSLSNSSEQRLSHGSAAAEQIEKKRKEKNIKEEIEKNIGKKIKYKDAAENIVERKIEKIEKIDDTYVKVYTEVDSFFIEIEKLQRAVL